MSEPAPDDYDVLGSTSEDKAWTYALLGAGGVALLTLGPLLAGSLAEIPVVPFGDQLEWIGGFDAPWAWAVRALLGLALGAAVAFFVLADEWCLEVHDDAIVVVHDEDRRRLPREVIVGIHLDGKRVVIDGDHGRRLFGEAVEVPRERIRRTLRQRGYPLEDE